MMFTNRSISKEESQRSKIWSQIFANDLGWKNLEHQSCRSQEVIQLCSSKLFHLNSFKLPNMHLNSFKFEIQILQMTSNGETHNIKGVYIKKL